jgi:diguanylate cyclase (GGDEF)-like protein/PAS domain S-box-containing protein
MSKNKQNKENTNLLDTNRKINPLKDSLRIAIWYSIFGLLWITISDFLLYWLVSDNDLELRIATAKGWLFVILTVVFIFLTVRRRIDIIKDFVDKMILTKKVLSSTEEELLIQKAITEEIIGKAPVIIIIWDQNGELKSVNPYAFEVLGYKDDLQFYSNWQDFITTSDNIANLSQVFKRLQVEGRLVNYETELITKSGSKVYVIWNSGILERKESGNTEYVSFGVDITDRRNAENTLKGIAYTDTLTGLPNRIALENEVKRRLAKVESKFALLYLDLDNFKYVNDSLGHHVGDELLKYLANCISKVIKSKDYVARLGGDEFAIIIGNYTKKDQVFDLIDKLKQEAGKTWYIYNHSFYISLSIGVALYPDNGTEVNLLSKNADIAMYSSKSEGKDRIMFFEETIEQNNLYHIEMAKKLQNAIESSEFELYYQPIFTLADNTIHGFEALLRWNEVSRGFISPAEFIPLAENTGQIYAIERWVFQSALSQKKAWNANGFNDITLSINLSSKTLISDVSFAIIESYLKEFNDDLSTVVVEITETALITDMHKVIMRVEKLKELGVKIALDDFGTGYSSLTHIKLLPVDIVKLDRSFISQVENKGKDEMIVSSVIELVKKLDHQLVAEGIETQDQYDYLVNNKVELGQGFLMSKPIPIQSVNLLLEKMRQPLNEKRDD